MRLPDPSAKNTVAPFSSFLADPHHLELLLDVRALKSKREEEEAERECKRQISVNWVVALVGAVVGGLTGAVASMLIKL